MSDWSIRAGVLGGFVGIVSSIYPLLVVTFGWMGLGYVLFDIILRVLWTLLLAQGLQGMHQKFDSPLFIAASVLGGIALGVQMMVGFLSSMFQGMPLPLSPYVQQMLFVFDSMLVGSFGLFLGITGVAFVVYQYRNEEHYSMLLCGILSIICGALIWSILVIPLLIVTNLLYIVVFNEQYQKRPPGLIIRTEQGLDIA
jgi:hypothetical protein